MNGEATTLNNINGIKIPSQIFYKMLQSSISAEAEAETQPKASIS